MTPSAQNDRPTGAPHIFDAAALAEMAQAETARAELSGGESALAQQYRLRRDAAAARAAAWSRWLGRLSVLRYCLLAIAGLALAGAAGERWPFPLAGLVAAVAVVGWLAATSAAERCQLAARYHDALRQINAESIARIERDWSSIPLADVELPAERRGLAGDLDLFGEASLFHLVCRAQTPQGIATLANWLLEAGSPEEIARRQRTVADLAGDVELHEEFAARGRLLSHRGPGTQELAHWAQTGPKAAFGRVIGICQIGSPAALALLAALFALGLIPVDAFGSGVLVVLGLNFLATVLLVGSIHDLVLGVLSAGHRVAQYRGQLTLLEGAVARRPSVAAALGAEGAAASGSLGALARLERLAWFARLARLPVVWLPIQLLTLWDFHIFYLVERWRRRHGADIPRWLEALGQFEAILSLSALAHDNPGWVFPRVDAEMGIAETGAEPGAETGAETGAAAGPEAGVVFRAEGLAHPLQHERERVANDVTLGPKGSVLFVTGSNMAGKSTLLRSIGTAVVLGQAGGPVCATRLEMRPIALGTVFRVQDSVQHGASLFLTELVRLKQVVDQARAVKGQAGTVSLFLLDEILHGTNTAERHIAARSVILELLGQGACGAVSTHDLDLPLEPKLAAAGRNVHFTDRVVGADGSPRLEFDYRLRDGIAQSTNALRLLAIIGLKADV